LRHPNLQNSAADQRNARRRSIIQNNNRSLKWR
jgi:hypothetical protein